MDTHIRGVAELTFAKVHCGEYDHNKAYVNGFTNKWGAALAMRAATVA